MQNLNVGRPRARTLARDQVFDHLAEDIAQLAVQPGEAISAAQLEEEFGVSRTPIREALIRLSHLGLIVLSPSTLTRAAPICARAQRERAEAAAALVITAAHDIAPRLTEDQYRELERCAAAVRTGAGFPREASAWWAFAREIIVIAGNPVIQEIFEMNLGLHLRRSLCRLDMPASISFELRLSLNELMLDFGRRNGRSAAQNVAKAFETMANSFAPTAIGSLGETSSAVR